MPWLVFVWNVVRECGSGHDEHTQHREEKQCDRGSVKYEIEKAVNKDRDNAGKSTGGQAAAMIVIRLQ